MKTRGILFSGAMVRALLDGTKTQTRRVVKPWHGHRGAVDVSTLLESAEQRAQALAWAPYGVSGDRLWVRETWGLCRFGDVTDWYRGKVGPTREVDSLREANRLEYRADHGPQQEHCFWRPSILMPRWASRITLEITDVRVERLHDISDTDIRAEGVTAQAVYDLGVTETLHDTSPIGLWRAGWSAINGAASWDANPWLWCLTLRRVS